MGVPPRQGLRLFGREIIPSYVITIPERHTQTDRRKDRQTTYDLITALCVASRGKNLKKTFKNLKQESHAVAKIAARCAQCMGNLKMCRIP